MDFFGRCRRPVMALDAPVDPEELRQRKLDKAVSVRPQPVPTYEDHEINLEFNPGHRYAHLFKKKNGASKANGYSMFVAEQISLAGNNRPRDPYAFYSSRWHELSDEAKLTYRAAADEKNGKVREQKTQSVWTEDMLRLKKLHPEMTEEQLQLESQRLEVGLSNIPEDQLIRLYWPPEPSGQRPLRGREHYEDLKLVRALYILMEKEEREKEERMLKNIEAHFSSQNFMGKKVYVLSCVPVSNDPTERKRIHQPLEISLVAFILAEGVCDVAFHRYIRAGDDVMSIEGGTCLEAQKAAWYQAHKEHNLPFVGFDPMNEDFKREFLEMEHFYDGWDVYVQRVLSFADSHCDVYRTVLDILQEDVDEEGRLPLVFTSLKNCEMVENCVEWLRKMAAAEAATSDMKNDFPEKQIQICSLEHFAWHVGELTSHSFSEKTIETQMNSGCFAHDYRLKCAYHEKRSNPTVCARGNALADVYNCIELLVDVCAISKTARHMPNSE